MLELMCDYNINVVVSSNTTPGKVTDKPTPVLLRTEFATGRAELFKICFEQFIHTGPSKQFASPIQLHASISPLL